MLCTWFFTGRYAWQTHLKKGRGSGGFTARARIEPVPGESAGQLYNLDEDLGETNNLYEQHPDIVARLSALLEQYRQQGHSRPSASN